MSLSALSKLKIYKHNNYIGATYHVCPTCSLPITFATLDYSYLYFIEANRLLKQIAEGSDASIKDPETHFQAFAKEVQLTFTNLQKNEWKNTTYCSPKSGILDFIEQITNIEDAA